MGDPYETLGRDSLTTVINGHALPLDIFNFIDAP